MRKVWIYTRPGRPGKYWVGWYEDGKRHSKALPTKALAEHYKQIKYVQLNSDVFTGLINVSWPDLKAEYRAYKKSEGVTESTLWDIFHTLELFEKTMGAKSSKQITEKIVRAYLTRRQSQVKSKWTVNKCVSTLNAFVKWAGENRYLSPFKISKIPVPDPKKETLDNDQIKKLLAFLKPTPIWYWRAMLCLCTGLRRGDVERLTIDDVDLKNATVATSSRKTGKSMPLRPLPIAIIPELTKYIKSLPEGETRLIPQHFQHRDWKKLRKAAGMEKVTFQQMRKTYGTMLATAGVNQSIVQRLLEHSTPELTSEFYINTDPALKKAVEKLPAAEWL